MHSIPRAVEVAILATLSLSSGGCAGKPRPAETPARQPPPLVALQPATDVSFETQRGRDRVGLALRGGMTRAEACRAIGATVLPVTEPKFYLDGMTHTFVICRSSLLVGEAVVLRFTKTTGHEALDTWWYEPKHFYPSLWEHDTTTAASGDPATVKATRP